MLLLLVLAGMLGAQVSAPVSVQVDEPIFVPKIVYPSEAKRARIQGVVELQVAVDAQGNVTEAHALSGPIPLRQAAVDAYAGAKYKPLMKGGRATPATVTTAVNFALQELPPDTDWLVERQFLPLHAACQQESRMKAAEAMATCRKALEMAARFSPGAELEARVTATNDLVLLMITDGRKSTQLEEAEVLADASIALIEQAGKASAHTPAVAIAYISRAEVRSLADKLQAAESDCVEAEETLQTLLRDQDENERTANYRSQLRETMLLHAVILDRQHRGREASKLKERAKQI